MTFGKRGWLLVPLSVVLGCASTQQAQKPTASGESSTLVDEGASSAKAAQAAPKASAPALVPFQGNGGFVVLMPPDPRRDEQTQDTPGGQVKMHIAQAQDVSGKYLITEKKSGNTINMYAGTWAGAGAGHNGKMFGKIVKNEASAQ